ncbi:MAG TPA: phosphatase PAP2 family protein [Anaerolineales bacterium]|nr:phosphatase PAP2 family protein [Anaerolineales bacterium]
MSTILELDARLSEKMRVAERPGALRAMAAVFAHSGDSWFWGLALIMGWFFSNSLWRKWEVVEFLGISVLAALVLVIKFRIRRKRPEGEWGRIYRDTDPHSFPSGHAARAFLIAVIASALAPTWLAILLWIWAPLVALARVAMGVHYLSDVLAGAILGALIAWLGLQIYEPILMWVSGFIGIPLW